MSRRPQKLTADQWTRHKAFCFWCLVASAATFATAPLVVPEAREAFSVLSERFAAPSLAAWRRTALPRT